MPLALACVEARSALMIAEQPHYEMSPKRGFGGIWLGNVREQSLCRCGPRGRGDVRVGEYALRVLRQERSRAEIVGLGGLDGA